MNGILWTAEERQAIVDWYPICGCKYVADMIGRNMPAVYKKAEQLGIKRDRKVWGAAMSLMKKGKQYGGRSAGNGTVVIRPNSRGQLVKWVRISPRRWEYYSRYVYKCEVGPIPEGGVIIHKDGNPMNCESGNLECIDRIMCGIKVQCRGEPEEMLEARYLICQLKKTIGEMKR
jgi:hypothetical protein